MYGIVAVLGLGLVLAGCAGARQALYDEMDRQVGVMTIAEAIHRRGPPTYERTLPSGETVLAWVEEQRHGYSGPAGYGVYSTSSVRRDTWTFVFGTNGRLKTWNHVRQ